MARGTITGREDLSRYDKSGSIWAEILEEIGQAIQEDEGFRSRRRSSELVKAKACTRDT